MSVAPASPTSVPLTADAVLREFIDDIESTGGVIRCGVGTFAPMADVTWTALGATDLNACAATGHSPMIALVGDFADDE